MIRRGLVCLILLWSITVPALAYDSNGSIRITFRFHGTPVSGGTVTLYEIGDMDVASEPEELVAAVQSKGIIGQKQEIDIDGAAVFADLKPGYYLLTQEKVPEGFYPIKPFCISLPITVGDQIQYHIEAYPKLEQISATKIPQTGQRILPVWGLMCIGLLLTALGFLLKRD